jgi:AcrR family transcriptional regulator
MAPVSPRLRIIHAAREHFVMYGYARASTNDILESASAHKASLYRYFKSKEDLCLATLDAIGAEFSGRLLELARKTSDWSDFVQRWTRLLRKEIRSGGFQGCPLSRIMAGAPRDAVRLQDRGREVYDSWAAVLEQIYAKWHSNSPEAADAPAGAGERILMIYEGAAQIYMLTGRMEVFDRMREELLRVK